jgi:hypothetical protein
MKTSALILLVLFSSIDALAATCRQIESFDHPNLVPNGMSLKVPGLLSQITDDLLHFKLRVKELNPVTHTKTIYRMVNVPYGKGQCQGTDFIYAGSDNDRGLMIHQDWGTPGFASWVKFLKKPTTLCGRGSNDVDESSVISMKCDGTIE